MFLLSSVLVMVSKNLLFCFGQGHIELFQCSAEGCSRTGTNVPVISVNHRVRTNPEIKMVMPNGGAIDPGGRADPISPNILLGFAARCLLHNLYKISLQLTMKQRC